MESDLRSPIKINDSLFLEGHLSTEYVLENIRKMIKKFGIAEDKLTIQLQKETQIQPFEVDYGLENTDPDASKSLM